MGHRIDAYVETAETILDTSTGLEWSKAIAPADGYFASPLFCATATIGGHADWRLPTRTEALSLVDFDLEGPMSWAPHRSTDPDHMCVWTATAGADGNGRWMVNFVDAHSVLWPVSQQPGAMVCTTRCVRGAPTNLGLREGVTEWAELPGGKAVLDRRYGTIWQTAPSAAMDDVAALVWCVGLAHGAGDRPWRLPTIRELIDLQDVSRHEPALAPPLVDDGSQGWSLISASPVVPQVMLWRADFKQGELRGLDGPPTAQRVRCIQ